MTTPPISELTPQQVWKLHAPPEQQWLFAGVQSWVPPTGDTVRRETAVKRVTSSRRMVLSKFWWNGKIRCPNAATLSGESLRGIPIESIPAGAPLVDVWVYSPDHGKPRLERIPLPKRPWIEGHPHVGGEFDRHWVGVYPDGSGWELIQLTWVPFGAEIVPEFLRWLLPKGTPMGPHWQAQECGRWSATGTLVSGYPVTAAGRRLADMVVTKAVLSLCAGPVGVVASNYQGGDGTLTDPASLRCGDHVVYRPPAGTVRPGADAGLLFDIATGPGLIVFDRGGDPTMPAGGIPAQCGAQWVGSNISDLTIPIADLELATSTT